MAELTDEIAELRDFSDEQVAGLLKRDDLLGLVGLMKNEPVGEVTGDDISDVFYLYMRADEQNALPSDMDLIATLNP